MKHPPSFIHSTQLTLNYNGLVLRNKGLHDAPANEVGYGADAEDYHVGGRLSLEAEEGEGSALLVGPGEEHTRALVDEERAQTTGHRTDTGDGSNGRLGEHIAHGREDVG